MAVVVVVVSLVAVVVVRAWSWSCFRLCFRFSVFTGRGCVFGCGCARVVVILVVLSVVLSVFGFYWLRGRGCAFFGCGCGCARVVVVVVVLSVVLSVFGCGRGCKQTTN